MTDGPRASPLGDHITRKDDKGDQPSGGETTWTNTGATRCCREQHKTGSFGDDMLRPNDEMMNYSDCVHSMMYMFKKKTIFRGYNCSEFVRLSLSNPVQLYLSRADNY